MIKQSSVDRRRVKAIKQNGQMSERGFVSIFAVMSIMTILGLIMVGFSTITRQAQRRTLDDQLSTQAFYSAESGINDAKVALTLAASTNTTLNKTDCTGQDAGNNFNYSVDPDIAVGYTCVQINSNPSDIKFSSVGVEGTGPAKSVILASSNGLLINRFSVSWDSKTTGDSIMAATTPVLSDRSGWANNVGILRMDVIPHAPGAGLNRDELIENTYTFFLYPTTSNTGVTSLSYLPGPDNQGRIDLVRCDSTSGLRCKVDITLGGTGNAMTNRYLLRMQGIYKDIQTNVADVKSLLTGSLVTLKDGQAVVDVTGKASDVFKRVQVRLPLKPTGGTATGYSSSSALITADSICKRLRAGPVTEVYKADIPAVAEGSCLID